MGAASSVVVAGDAGVSDEEDRLYSEFGEALTVVLIENWRGPAAVMVVTQWGI